MSRFGKTATFLPDPDNGNCKAKAAQSRNTQDKSCETSFTDATDKYSACAVLKKQKQQSGPGPGLGQVEKKRKVEFSDKCVNYCEIPRANGANASGESETSEREHRYGENHVSESVRDYQFCDTKAKFGSSSSISCVVKGAAQVEINAKHRNYTSASETDEEYGTTPSPVILNPANLDLSTLNGNQKLRNLQHSFEIQREKTSRCDFNKTSTFGTPLRPTFASRDQRIPQDNCLSTVTLTLTKEQQQQEKQRQWEAELDLIVPASEPDYSSVSVCTSGDTSTLTSPPTEQPPYTASDSSSNNRNSNPAVVEARRIPPEPKGISLPSAGAGGNQPKKPFTQNSRIILVPDTSSYVPDSRTGSSIHLPQQQQGHPHRYPQFSPTSTTLSTISTDKSSIEGRRRTGFCAGFELDVRQICVVCGFLIVAAALGVGVGVPIALQLQTHSKKDDWKHDTVRKLLSEVPLIDGHNDLAWNLRKFLQNQLLEINFDKDLRQYEPFAGSPWSHTDLKRLREGRVGTQLWSAYVPCSAQHLDAVQVAMEQIDVIKRLVDKYQNSLSLVKSVNDIETAHSENKIGSLIAVEGGHSIGNSLAVLRTLYDLGARSLTLTHNCNTPWADSASSDHYLPDRGGLTEFGKLVVLECNRLGLIVDLAHVSAHTMGDALTVSRAPVIFSHSAASSLCNHSRNVPDEIMKLVTTNGGLVMVSFYNVFLACNETATMDDVIAHIEHIRQVAGVDHVGIGAGYDGINFVPSGLEDVSKYPDLIEALYNRDGWTELDLKKLIGLNFLRVFRRVEEVRDEWQHVGVGPIEEWIPKNELAGHPMLCSSRGTS